MYTVAYYKIGTKWYLDLPEYLEKGDADDLERIGSFHDFLEMVSDKNDLVKFEMDTEPFEGADELKLIASTSKKSGGYYYINSLHGKKIDLELWFNSVIYYRQATLPEKIYIRQST